MQNPCFGCPASFCGARNEYGDPNVAADRPSGIGLASVAAGVFGVPVLLLCLLVPIVGSQPAWLQGLLIGLTLLSSWALCRWLAPALERQVHSEVGVPPGV
ncbi:MAG: hypothetical protein ACR2PZ_20790 [Pseudomonadales bacterium]